MLERQALTQKTSLVLVEVDGKSVLLTVGADNVSSLQLESENEALVAKTAIPLKKTFQSIVDEAESTPAENKVQASA